MNISRYRLRQFVKHLSCDMPLIAASVNWRCSFKCERNKKKEEEEECYITFFFFLFALYARAWKWIIAADYMRASITLRALISSTGAAADVLLRPFFSFSSIIIRLSDTHPSGGFISNWIFLSLLECVESLRIDCAGSSYTWPDAIA